MNCTFPWTGMTIDPQGFLTLCCMIDSKKGLFNKHITEIDSLYDFFYGKEYDKVRLDFHKYGWENIKDCAACLNDKRAGRFTTVDISQRFDSKKNTLQYLELTTSNTCNQQCVTCGSKFSSKWKKIEKYFDRPVESTYSLTTDDLEKVLEVLPDLEHLTLKGGEPFADMRNLQILTSLLDINRLCKITIITNGVLIPKPFQDIIKKYPYNFDIVFSIDAIGKRYDWIRGTPFKKTIENLKLISSFAVDNVNIVPTISTFNVHNINEIIEWHDTLDIKTTLQWSNVVHEPRWCSPIHTMTQEEINICNLPVKVISEYNEKYKVELEKNTKIMDKLRGFEFNSLQ